MKTIASLTTTKQREEWEKLFNKMYIQPVLTNLEKNIQAGVKSVFEDSKTGKQFLSDKNNICVGLH